MVSLPLASHFQNCERDCHHLHGGHEPCPVLCAAAGADSRLSLRPIFSRIARRDVKDFFEKVGTVLEIPESQFDVFTVTFSSSHGYHALAALAASAQRLGLNREIAMTAAAHALRTGFSPGAKAKFR